MGELRGAPVLQECNARKQVEKAMAARVASRRTLGIALLACLFAACSGDSPSPTEPPVTEPPITNPPGNAITPEARIASIEAVGVAMDQLIAQGLEGDALNDAIRDWLAARPEFEAAGVEEGSGAWARFTDGRMLILTTDRDPAEPDTASEGGTGASAQATPAALRAATQAGAVVASRFQRAGAPQAVFAASAGPLPASRQVRLMNAFGPGFAASQKVIDELHGWFTDAGYTLASGSGNEASLADLRQVSGDGFVYVNAHGGRGRKRDLSKMFSIQSSTKLSLDNERDPQIAAELAAEQIVYHGAYTGVKKLGLKMWDVRYGITYRFVEKYWDLGDNAVVFLNVCYSAAAHDEVASFVFAMHKAGAGQYLGWSGTVSTAPAFKAVRYFVDRALGANEYRAEDPRQRPFDLASVFEEMKAAGLARDNATGAQLELRPSAVGANAILAPSIYALRPGEDGEDELYIHGTFGSDPGESNRSVTIGGQQMSVDSWTDAMITVPIPRTGAGSSGDVVVTSLGRKSNARALVVWRGSLNYTLDAPGSLAQSMEFDLNLRGDPDRARKQPGADPEDLPATFWLQPIRGGTGTYSAGGSHTETPPGDPCTYTEQWSGSGPMEYGPNTGGAFGLMYGGIVQDEPRKLNLYLVAFGSQTVTRRMGGDCNSELTTNTNFVLPLDLLFDNGVPRLIDMDGTYGIPADRIQKTVSKPFSSDGGTAQATLEWQVMAAQPAHARDQKK